MPAHDTVERVFARLDPPPFQVGFREWMLALSGARTTTPRAIDGKTLRGSRNAVSGLGPLPLVGAGATQNHLSRGQVAVDANANAITAIPQWLELLDWHGAGVTIDAGGDYLLLVKGDQGQLLDDVQDGVGPVRDQGVGGRDSPIATKVEQGHGREEKRTYVVIPEPEGIGQRENEQQGRSNFSKYHSLLAFLSPGVLATSLRGGYPERV